MDIEELLAERSSVTLAEFASITGLTLRAVEQRHARGSLGVSVERAKHLGRTRLTIPADEVRRWHRERGAHGDLVRIQPGQVLTLQIAADEFGRISLVAEPAIA